MSLSLYEFLSLGSSFLFSFFEADSSERQPLANKSDTYLPHTPPRTLAVTLILVLRIVPPHHPRGVLYDKRTKLRSVVRFYGCTQSLKK